MKISDIYANNQITNQGRTAQGQEVVVHQGAGQAQESTSLRDLAPGQILRGELVGTENGDIQIKLSNNTLINARLDQNIALEPGKAMNFQVRSNGQTIMLTPLQANLSVEGPISKALEMANLPINSATGELTKLLMQGGLPIDKNHLQQYYREMIQQPAGQISDLVDLHRLGMPVTEENLNQISSYKNLTHQLISGLEQTSAELMQTVSELSAQGKPVEAATLFQDILQVMTKEMAEEGTQAGNEMSQTVQKPASDIDGTLQSAFEGNGRAEVKGEADGTSGLERFQQELLKLVPQDQEGSQAIFTKEQYAQTLEQVLGQTMPEKEQIDLMGQLLRRGISEQNKDLLQALVDSPAAKKLLTDQFAKQWTITPEQVQDPKEVENLYHRLGKQLRGISEALENIGQTQTNAYQSSSNMNQNLDFLNQLNHMYSYVQLPLKLQQGEAHGDLYVYTRKRNLADKDEPITALLHLDMEHLGPLDVYVSMQNQKVGTKFTVADDETLDFLEEHMDILTQRLEKRGYQISVQTSVKEDGDSKDNSGIHPILKNASPGMLIQARGFDVRT